MTQTATIENSQLRGYHRKDRIRQLSTGSEYDNKILAGRIIERYLKHPMSEDERKVHILNALKKFHYRTIDDEEKKKIEKQVMDAYGTRGWNIINSIWGSAEKENGIENTLAKLTLFGGKLKGILEEIIKKSYPEILSQKRIYEGLKSIRQNQKYANDPEIRKIQENYDRLSLASFGSERGYRQNISKVREYWKHLEGNLSRVMEKIHETEEINNLINEGIDNYQGL